MNHLDLIEDYISSEKQYLADCLLSQKAAYFPLPIAANLSLDKLGYTSDLISKIASEQKAATLMNGVLEKQRQAVYKLANPRLDLKSILENEHKAIIEAANPRLEIIAKIREGLALDFISNTVHHYRPNSRKISTQQPAKRSRTYEKPSSYNDDSNIFIFEPKSKPEKPLSVDHSRLKRIAEHEKRLAELKENTHPIMEIRQVVFLVMPDIDANQEREALAKAIIASIKYGYLKLEWVQDKEGFIHKPVHQQILASIHINDFTHCANAGWLGDDAPAMALQWHSYLVKPKSALLIPPESNTDDLKRRDKQVEALLKVIEKISMNPQALTVGGGNKKRIHDACVCEYPQLFTLSIHTFNGIWQAALKKGVIKIAENSRAKDKGSYKNH